MRLHAPYHDYKLAVDSINVYEDRVECDCYTLGMPSSEEPECFSRIVSMEQLRDVVCFNGMVDITCPYDEQETITVSFERWLEDSNYETIGEFCAIAINKLEGRTQLYMPEIIPQLPGGDLFGNHTIIIRKVA